MKENKSEPWQKSGTQQTPYNKKAGDATSKQPHGNKGGCGCPSNTTPKHNDTYNKQKPGRRGEDETV